MKKEKNCITFTHGNFAYIFRGTLRIFFSFFCGIARLICKLLLKSFINLRLRQIKNLRFSKLFLKNSCSVVDEFTHSAVYSSTKASYQLYTSMGLHKIGNSFESIKKFYGDQLSTELLTKKTETFSLQKIWEHECLKVLLMLNEFDLIFGLFLFDIKLEKSTKFYFKMQLRSKPELPQKHFRFFWSDRLYSHVLTCCT